MRLKHVLSLTLCFLAFLLLPGGAPALALDAPPWPHEQSGLAPDPALIFERLENGFGCVLMRNTEPKNRVSIKFAVLAGSYHEQEKERGIAHYLEHMAFNGSDHFKPGELIKYFQSIGMDFGNDVNAQTGFEETIYQLMLPDGGREHLEKGLTVMADYAMGLHLLPEEVERERGVILAEKQARDSVGYRTFKKSLEFFMDGARVCQRMPIGLEEVILAADPPLLRGFHDAWYRPDNAFLVIVGDFEPRTALSLVREKFSAFKPRDGRPAPPDVEKVRHKGVKTFHHYEPEAGSTDVSIETVKWIKREPDTLALEKRRLLEAMANTIVKHRLDALKERPDCPFTDASVGSGVFLKHYAYSSASASCAPENWKASLERIEQILRQALKHGFTESEVERVRKEFEARLETAAAKAATRDSGALARLIVRNLADGEVLMSPAQEKELFLPVVQNADRRALHKAFKKVWPKNHRLVLVTGNADVAAGGADPESVIREAFEQSGKVKVRKPAEEAAAAFPYLPSPEKPGVIVEKQVVEDLGVVRVRFENGVSLNIKKTDFKDNEILASLRLGSGRSGEPKDKPGLAILAQDVVNGSGLGGLTRDQLVKALAGKSTSMSLHISQDAIFQRASTIPEELPLLFQWLQASLQDPGFRPEAHERAMERFNQMYEGFEHSVDGAIALRAKSFFAGGDSRFGNPPREQFMSLTLQDVKSWIGPVLASSELEITVVGDLDVDEVMDLAALHLGGLPPRKALDDGRGKTLRFPKGERLRVEVDSKIPKAVVMAAYPTADIWNISRTRRLSVLASVFSDRLMNNIREKLGLTYSPQAVHHPYRAYPDYGLLTAFITADPASTGQVVDAVKEIAADLAKNGVTDEELQRALLPSVTSIKDLLRKNTYWLNTVLSGSTAHPEKLEWSRTILSDYASITPEDVSAFARQYLVNQNCAVAVMVSK